MDVRWWAGEARFKHHVAEVEGVPGVLAGRLDRDRGRPADSFALAWPVNYRFHRRSCLLPVPLRHRLVPQPGGFEGLRAIPEKPSGGQASGANIPHMRGLEFDRQSTRTPLRAHEHDDPSTGVEESLRIEAPLGPRASARLSNIRTRLTNPSSTTGEPTRRRLTSW